MADEPQGGLVGDFRGRRRTCQRASSSVAIGRRSSSTTGSFPPAISPRASIASRSPAAVISSTSPSPARQPCRSSRVEASGLLEALLTSRRSIETTIRREGSASGILDSRAISSSIHEETASLPPGSSPRSRLQASRRASLWARALLIAGASAAAQRREPWHLRLRPGSPDDHRERAPRRGLDHLAEHEAAVLEQDRVGRWSFLLREQPRQGRDHDRRDHHRRPPFGAGRPIASPRNREGEGRFASIRGVRRLEWLRGWHAARWPSPRLAGRIRRRVPGRARMSRGYGRWARDQPRPPGRHVGETGRPGTSLAASLRPTLSLPEGRVIPGGRICEAVGTDPA